MNKPKSSQDPITPFLLAHIGSFISLMLLSTLRPAGLHLPIPAAPIALLALLFITAAKIHATIGFRCFLQKYKVELLLLFLYQSICVISIFLNINKYDNVAEVIRWGLTFVIIQGAFPICLFLFLLPQNNHKISFSTSALGCASLVIFLSFICINAIIQHISPDIAFPLNQFFISSDYYSYLTQKLQIPPKEAYAIWGQEVMSIFAIATDLGAISAIIVAALFLQLLNKNINNSQSKKSVIYILIVLFMITGAISGSRNFFLSSGVFLFLYITMLIRTPFAQKLLLFTSLLLVCLSVLYVSPISMISKLSLAAPFLEPFNLGQCISQSQLTLRLDENLLGPRWDMWKGIFDTFLENPIWGISNGGFRLSSGVDREIYNTHNIFLQILNDSGLIGFFVISILMCTVLYKIFNTKSSHPAYVILVCVVVLTTTLVDLFVDHSVAWIVVSTYAIAITCKIENTHTGGKSMEISSKFVYLFFVFSCLLLLMTVVHYFMRTKDCYLP